MKPIDDIDLERVIFLDIRTSCAIPFEQLEENIKNIFFKKMERKGVVEDINNIDDLEKRRVYEEKAPNYPEWGKINTISVGRITNNEDHTKKLKISVIQGEEESSVLGRFLYDHGADLNKLDGKPNKRSFQFNLCSFFLKNKVHVFISKRILSNDISLPLSFDIAMLKPWEKHHLIDINDLWNFSSANISSINDVSICMGMTDEVVEGENEEDNVNISINNIKKTVKIFLKLKDPSRREEIKNAKKETIEV